MQDALSNGTITEQAVKGMGYSCEQIKPTEWDFENRRTWTATYAYRWQKVAEEAVVKRLLWKNREGKQIYEIEGDTMDRFHRPYKWTSQRLAENMERI